MTTSTVYIDGSSDWGSLLVGYNAGVGAHPFNMDGGSLTTFFGGILQGYSGGGVRSIATFDNAAAVNLNGGSAWWMGDNGGQHGSQAAVIRSGTVTLDSSSIIQVGVVGGLKFAITNTSSNRITGTGTVELDGSFTIDASAVTASSGTWSLVDVASLSEVYGPDFALAGAEWTALGGVWTKLDGLKTWTFTADTGILTLTSSAAASYADWATAFTSPPLADSAANADPDHGGLTNAVEYVLGTDPRFSNQGGPVSSIVGTDLIFTFNRKDSSETPDVGLRVEVSTDLTDWTSLPGYDVGATTASSSPGVNVAENGANDDIITVTIPMGAAAKKFARLTVTIAP